MAKAENEMTYNFLVEWYDNQSQTPRQFNFAYFLLDGTIEMYDFKTRRTFLKRCPYPDLVVQDLFIGAQVTVYARQLRILDFGDAFTRRKLSQVTSRVIAFIPPQRLGSLGAVLHEAHSARVTIGRMKSLQLHPQQAVELLQQDQPTPLAKTLCSGPVVALELVGPAAKEVLAGAADAGDVIFGTGSDFEAKYLFENTQIATTAVDRDCTICIVKPHAWQAGKAGELVNEIQQQFRVAALALLSLDRIMAQEFLGVYQGVLPEYNQMIDELAKGPCLVLQLQGQGVLKQLRQMCGPPDPEIARYLEPESLRARFGVNRVCNAVHCTDLEEDGPLESGFFFETVQNVESIKHGYF